MQTLNFYPGKVKGLNWNGGKPTMTVELLIQNTSNQDYTLNSMAGNLYANGTLVGNLSVFNPVSIKRNSQTILDVQIKMLLIGMLDNIIDAITNGAYKVTLELDSYANVDNLQIPVDITYKVA